MKLFKIRVHDIRSKRMLWQQNKKGKEEMKGKTFKRMYRYKANLPKNNVNIISDMRQNVRWEEGRERDKERERDNDKHKCLSQQQFYYIVK